MKNGQCRSWALAIWMYTIRLSSESLRFLLRSAFVFWRSTWFCRLGRRTRLGCCLGGTLFGSWSCFRWLRCRTRFGARSRSALFGRAFMFRGWSRLRRLRLGTRFRACLRCTLFGRAFMFRSWSCLGRLRRSLFRGAFLGSTGFGFLGLTLGPRFACGVRGFGSSRTFRLGSALARRRMIGGFRVISGRRAFFRRPVFGRMIFGRMIFSRTAFGWMISGWR